MSNEKELNRRKEVDDLISKYARKKAPPMPPPPTTGHSQHGPHTKFYKSGPRGQLSGEGVSQMTIL